MCMPFSSASVSACCAGLRYEQLCLYLTLSNILGEWVLSDLLYHINQVGRRRGKRFRSVLTHISFELDFNKIKPIPDLIASVSCKNVK